MRPIARGLLGLLLLASAARAAAPGDLVPPARAAGPAPARLASAAFVPGEVLALVAPGSPLATAAQAPPGAGAAGRSGVLPLGLAALRAADPALGDALARHGLARIEDLRRATPPGERRFAAVRLASDAPGFDARAAAADLLASGSVLAATPNLQLAMFFTPNDPYLGAQWQFSTSAAAVRARPAWDLEQGSAAVVIAVLDCGVDLTHSDLVSQIWRNPGEIAGNGLDDDHDGYADDVNGWDFGDADSDPNPDPLGDPTSGIDVGWHGTFVAGLAAAATNNGIGMAGTAPGCRILPLKVTDAFGNLTLAAVTSAFDYAAARHVAVLNVSIGTSDPAAAAFFQSLVDEAFAAGVVCVAAAGNSGTDAMTWPAACDHVLAVASTNASNLRSPFSSWGDWVDVAAPGEAVWSCIARNYAYDPTSLYYFGALWGFDGVHAYMSNDGTSFAAPIVAGAAALVRSHAPWLTAAQVLQQIPIDGDARTYDNVIGPRLDIERALQYPLDAPPASLPATVALAASPNPASVSAGLAFTLPRGGTARLAILDAQGRRIRTLFSGALAAGAHSAAWDTRDERGRPAAAGLYFAVLDADGQRTARRIAIVR